MIYFLLIVLGKLLVCAFCSPRVNHTNLYFAGKGTQLVQKKKTIYPEWNTSFDAHLYDGRVIRELLHASQLKSIITLGSREMKTVQITHHQRPKG